MNVNGIRGSLGSLATAAAERLPEAASRSSKGIKRSMIQRDDVDLGLGPLSGKREQRKSEADDARRKLEALQRELEELKDRSGFESFFAGLFGSDNGAASRDSDRARMYDGASATRFLRDPD